MLKNYIFLLITSVVAGFLFSASIFAQQENRTLKNKKWKNEPLQIFNLKVEGKQVKFREKFVGSNDWFRNLSVSVKNVSDKTVVFIDLSLIFPANEAVVQNVPSRDHLIYGNYPVMLGETTILHVDQPPLNPGDTATLILSDYAGTREFLNQTGKPQSIKEIEIEISEVIFADGTKWIGGHLHRRDPNNPNKWILESNSNSITNRNKLLNLSLFKKVSFDFFNSKNSEDSLCREKTSSEDVFVETLDVL